MPTEPVVISVLLLHMRDVRLAVLDMVLHITRRMCTALIFARQRKQELVIRA